MSRSTGIKEKGARIFLSPVEKNRLFAEASRCEAAQPNLGVQALWQQAQLVLPEARRRAFIHSAQSTKLGKEFDQWKKANPGGAPAGDKGDGPMITIANAYSATCPVCGKVFERDTRAAAQRAMHGHYGRAHERVSKEATRRNNGQEAGRNGQTRSAEVQVNFCPQCGCNLHAVATGIAMASHS